MTSNDPMVMSDRTILVGSCCWSLNHCNLFHTRVVPRPDITCGGVIESFMPTDAFFMQMTHIWLPWDGLVDPKEQQQQDRVTAKHRIIHTRQLCLMLCVAYMSYHNLYTCRTLAIGCVCDKNMDWTLIFRAKTTKMALRFKSKCSSRTCQFNSHDVCMSMLHEN